MNRRDLRELQAVHDYPCLTITLSTHRTFPDNRQDQIVDPTAPDVLDDAVDEVITQALDKRGRVAFVNDGGLSLHDRIALVLRY